MGNKVWDKDGLLLWSLSQLTAELKRQGKTVWDQLENIYRQHGMYINAQHSTALDQKPHLLETNYEPRSQAKSQAVKSK